MNASKQEKSLQKATVVPRRQLERRSLNLTPQSASDEYLRDHILRDDTLSQSSESSRIVSIDILRGLTIFIMIFVNDIGELAHHISVPLWLQHFHQPLPDGGKDWLANGMTFVDVVFPAFLFIVGMALPFSIGRRFERDEALPSILQHVLIRTVGLLIIGVFMVNSYMAPDGAMRFPQLWIVLMYVGVILTWNVVPRKPGRFRDRIINLKIFGVLLLALLALVYKGGGEERALIELQTSWWGILGLIGWAYLVASICYILFRKDITGMLISTALLYTLFAVDRTEVFQGLWLRSKIDFGSMLGSHAAITCSGAAFGMMLIRTSSSDHCKRLRLALVFSWGMFIIGILLYQLRGVLPNTFIINKNLATPPWCLISSAITIWAWIIIYWLSDIRGWTRWAGFLKPGGENPLFAYILQPLIYAIFALLGGIIGYAEIYHGLGANLWIGIGRALLLAWFVTWLAGSLKSRGVWLKL